MAFIYNIPQATDDPSISQGQFLGNFTALGAIAGNGNPSSNSLDSTAGFDWILLAAQANTPPIPANFQAGVIGMYSALSSITGVNELYINKTNQATVFQAPVTESILSTNSAPAALSQGWTYLPSGLILKWGTGTSITGQFTFNYLVSASIPAFTATISVQLQILYTPAGDSNKAISLRGVSATGFTGYISNRTTTGAGTSSFTYFAIGY